MQFGRFAATKDPLPSDWRRHGFYYNPSGNSGYERDYILMDGDTPRPDNCKRAHNYGVNCHAAHGSIRVHHGFVSAINGEWIPTRYALHVRGGARAYFIGGVPLDAPLDDAKAAIDAEVARLIPLTQAQLDDVKARVDKMLADKRANPPDLGYHNRY